MYYLSVRGDESCFIVEADVGSGPFSSDDALEARLISTGSVMLHRLRLDGSVISTEPLERRTEKPYDLIVYKMDSK